VRKAFSWLNSISMGLRSGKYWADSEAQLHALQSLRPNGKSAYVSNGEMLPPRSLAAQRHRLPTHGRSVLATPRLPRAAKPMTAAASRWCCSILKS
jgi:hypothetical protein